MLGRGPRPLVEAAVVLLVVFVLTLPVGALEASTATDDVSLPEWSSRPARNVPADLVDPFAWTETVAMERLPGQARHEAEAFGPTRLPAPDVLPGYADLPESMQREAWKVWLTLSATPPSMPSGSPWTATAAQEPADAPATAEGLGAPRGLKGIWSLDSHGSPRQVRSAGDDGETFLVTSHGVMRFGGANATPDWMVKPGGFIGRTETTDHNGDGVLDIVLGTRAWYATEDPSIVVVDGKDGSVLWAGLSGKETLLDWTLTDVDGDGTDDILGVDQMQQFVAYRVDGTKIYSERPEGLPEVGPVGLIVVYLYIYHDAYDRHAFGDVDGDGVMDLFVLSDYNLYARAHIVGQSVGGGMLAAVSGKDLSVLWSVPMEPLYRPRIDVSGDFDGDGSDDVLVTSYFRAYLPGVSEWEQRWTIRAGSDGRVLADDRAFGVRTCPMDCVTHETREGERWPFAMADVDADGAAELITVEPTEDPKVPLAISGLTSDVAGGPLKEAWRHEVALDAAHDEVDLYEMMLRDPDGDGTPELIIIVGAEDRTDEGALEDLAMYVFRTSAAGMQGGRMPELLGYWDVGGDGQAYGWTVRDDRWRPLDDAGIPQALGLRLITRSYPMLTYDITDDKVPDLFVRKTVGFMWIDGRNGALLHDMERPIGSYVQGIYEEGSQHRLLERNWGEGTYSLLTLETLEPVWTLAREELDEGWLRDVTDVTGDGKLDVVVEKSTYIEDEMGLEGPRSFGRGREETTTVRDMTTQKIVWERDTSDTWVRFADVLPARPGTEIMLTVRDDESSLQLHVFDETEPRWSYVIGNGGYRATDLGYILVSNEQEGEVYEVLSADTGELVSSYPLPADGHASQTYFTRVDADRFPDLVMSIAVEEAEDDYTQEMIVYDWAREEEMSRFPLEKPKMRTFYWGDHEFTHPSYSYITENIGDWDGDGLIDFAYRETDRPLVRSSVDGRVLAMAPGKGSVIEAVDLNGDGRLEIGVYTDSGRLRFFAYASGATAEDLADEEDIRVIKQVEGAQAENDTDAFFGKAEKKGLPAPGALFSVALIGALVALVRRRD